MIKTMLLEQRSIERIKPLLEQLKILWHYYPALSLAELVEEVVETANIITSKLPPVEFEDIEDIAYPRDHYLHSRNIEESITILMKKHKAKVLPPVPFQTAFLKDFERMWRRNNQMRLGQLLLLPTRLELAALGGI